MAAPEQPADSDRPTAVVTGAASGIGRALAQLLAEDGYDLCLADIDADGLERVASAVGAETADATDVADAAQMDALAARSGPIDLLCLNAGVLSPSMGPPWEVSPSEWDRVMGVNLGGVVNGLRSFVPGMLARPEPSRILITASLAGALTWPAGGAYAASKHAALAVAEQAALGLADSHVSVTVMCPALVRTAMSEEGDDPVEVAQRGLRAATDGQFAVIDDEWADALHTRARTLSGGGRPELPLPVVEPGPG